MITPRTRIPNLPDTWPFEPRTALPPWVRVEKVDLGELGGGWVRVGPQDLNLAAKPEDLGQAFGRGGIHRRGQVVVRAYRRGGLMRKVNARTYPGERRFQAEGEIHRALWENGFPTVEPLGYAFRPHAWGVEGLFFSRFVEAVPWPMAFGRTPELLPQFRRLLDSLAEWGLRAPDLNATNFIIRPEGELLALDWDRARWARYREGLRQAHLDRILRSLAKLMAPLEIRALIASLA